MPFTAFVRYMLLLTSLSINFCSVTYSTFNELLARFSSETLRNYIFVVDTPCGVPLVQPVTKRIVGWKIAVPGSWPWTVSLSD